jgi:hypothetical protein
MRKEARWTFLLSAEFGAKSQSLAAKLPGSIIYVVIGGGGLSLICTQLILTKPGASNSLSCIRCQMPSRAGQ